MSTREAEFEKKRNRIAGLLEYNGFSKERGDSGEDIYAKNGQQVTFLGKHIRYSSGGAHIDLEYGKPADEFFYLTIGELPTWKYYAGLANKRVRSLIQDIREAA